MNWLLRIERQFRKYHRTTIKRNVRAYRKRQELAGIRRIDLALSVAQYSKLLELMQPEETYSATISRLISGNTK